MNQVLEKQKKKKIETITHAILSTNDRNNCTTLTNPKMAAAENCYGSNGAVIKILTLDNGHLRFQTNTIKKTGRRS